MKIQCSAARKFIEDTFSYVGIPAPDAAQAAEVVYQADFTGVLSHGLQRLPMYLNRIADGAVNKNPQLRETARAAGCMSFDGDNGLGIVNAPRVMDRVIEEAKKNGIAAATLSHSNHPGVGNYYGWKAAEAGVVGIFMSNTTPIMAPTGGSKALLGTNPVVIAFPARKSDPVVLDISTSITSLGKVQVMAGRGEKLPEGWALDKNGAPTTDGKEAFNGTLLPVGGHKGYGLAVIIDLFSAVLAGACFGDNIGRLGIPGSKEPEGVGQFFMALDVSKFIDEDSYYQQIESYIDMMHSCPLTASSSRIFMPGEIEYENSRRIQTEGMEVPPATEQRLITTLRKLSYCREDESLSDILNKFA